MSRQVKIPLIAVVALLVTVAAFVELSPKGRYSLQLFDPGVKHGIEDKQTGIKYATDSPGWKIMRNGYWTSREKILVQRLLAEPPASARNDTSIFMAGYTWGSNNALCWTLLAIVLVGASVLIVGIPRRNFSQSRPQGIV